MDLESYITAVACVTDDCVREVTREHKLRQRGPKAVLADSEVLTMEIVGEFLGLSASTPTAASSTTSAGTTQHSSRASRRSTARRSRVRRRTSGGSSAACGSTSPPELHTTR
jgi:hypothetical protein